MRLLIETRASQNLKLIKEDKQGKRQYFLEGVFMQSEIKNRNGRIYPEATLDKAVKTYIEGYVKKNRAYGELNHPDSPNIDLNKASHLITELRKEGKNYYGKAKVLSTNTGETVKRLMEDGCNLGISSRGLGSLKEDGGSSVVQDDFYLVTAGDIVADPSAPAAFLENIMESREWLYDRGKWVPAFMEQTKKEVKKTNTKQLEELALKKFEQFLREISNNPS